MKAIKESLINFLSQKKVIKTIDISIFIIAVVSLVLIVIGGVYIKILNVESPIDIDYVALFMMLGLIFCFGLKLFVHEQTKIAFQLILLVLLLVAMTSFVAIAKRLILSV